MNVEEFLDAISFFGEPGIKEGVEKHIILAPYVQELAKYEGDTLAEAIKLMMVRRNYRNFPLLRECLDLCVEAEKRAKPVERRTAPIVWSGSRKTAQQLVMDNINLARDAAREGWMHGLWDFCRVNQRGPFGEKEIQQCKDDAAEFRRIRMKAHCPDADAREERLKKLVFGEAA